jgi:hypothetical protein
LFDVINHHRKVMVLWLEGGRTCTGKTFQWSQSGRKKIRQLKRSVVWLIKKSKAPVFTVWLENGDVPDQPHKKLFSLPNFKRGPIVVKLGSFVQFPRELKNIDSSEVASIIANNLLVLADQE